MASNFAPDQGGWTPASKFQPPAWSVCLEAIKADKTPAGMSLIGKRAVL